ncbi:MAG: ferredoxin--NADP reductase [Anaerolineaceae bacterium]|nr:ferredoxin--NADP reductase [Anaerolineaceae bacterium]
MVDSSLNAIVTSKVELSPRVMTLRVAANGWDMPDFTPGQFGVLGLPGSAPRAPWSEAELTPSDPDQLIRRPYSITSSSKTREYMEFYISMLSTGALTPRLFALKVGDPIWLGPKTSGIFTLNQVPKEKHIVMVATGTGLAPYISMLTTELQCGSDRRFAVLHGAYHSWDLGYRSELQTMQYLCQNFNYISTIDKPNEEPVPWGGKTGWVQEVWKSGAVADAWGLKPTPENTHVFLCGVSGMVNAMLEALNAEGFVEHTKQQEGQIHIERFV